MVQVSLAHERSFRLISEGIAKNPGGTRRLHGSAGAQNRRRFALVNDSRCDCSRSFASHHLGFGVGAAGKVGAGGFGVVAAGAVSTGTDSAAGAGAGVTPGGRLAGGTSVTGAEGTVAAA